MAADPLIRATGLCKSFPGVRALHQVGLEVRPGEVVAVVGENGAGKSTLMKILAGVQPPDAGEIEVGGRPVRFRGVRDAAASGIALIHQELNLCSNLSVGANIFLGAEPRGRFRIDERAIFERSAEQLDRVGLEVDPRTPLADLSLGQQQLVEIAKALAANASVLIMDEPTSSLSTTESQRLFSVIHDLRRRGVAVLYISHRLGEVQELADRVEVLRDGEHAGALRREEITHEALVQLMVGREARSLYRHEPKAPGPVQLQIEGLRTRAHPHHAVDLQVHAGEIVGLAGLVGAGRSELLRAVFGADRAEAGSVRVGTVVLRRHHPADAIAAGLAFAPEDRKEAGLLLEQSVIENLQLARLPRDRGRCGFLSRRAFEAEADRLVDDLGIRVADLHQVVGTLSGGNQQKVVLGKWLTTDPAVVLLDEPTRGIDVGAKAEIYALMDQLAAVGVAVLFASSEMEEVLGIADRVAVMHEGRIAGFLPREQLSEAAIMRLATGHEAAAS